MPSKSAAKHKQKPTNGRSVHSAITESASSSSSTFTKWPLLVLLASCGLGYLCYNLQQSGDAQELSIITQLDLFIDSTQQTLQQWTRPLWSKLRAAFGLTIRPDSVLKGLLHHEQSVTVRTDSAIAIGLGACTDLIVESLEIFEKFAAPSNPKPHAQIESMQDLLELYAYYFKHGAASE